jgi:chromosome segregation ATPase
MSLDQQFNTINDKLQQLLRQQARLRKENERLRTELDEWRSKEINYQQKIEELQQQVQILKFSAGEMTERDKKDFEKKINQYVKEIDRCIAFLSQ